MKTDFSTIACILSLLMALGCGTKVAGPGNETETISGLVYYPDETKAANAKVTIRNPSYLADTSSGAIVPRELSGDVLTDSKGYFTLDLMEEGDWIIEVNDGESSTALVQISIGEYPTSRKLAITLKPAARISGRIQSDHPDRNAPAYVQVYGLDRLSRTDSTGYFQLDMMPAGDHNLRIVSLDSSYGFEILENVQTTAGQTRELDTVILTNVCLDLACDTAVARSILADNNLFETDLTPLMKIDSQALRLTSLDLSGLGLTALPEQIQNLISLKALNLSANQLTEIPRVLSRIAGLRELNFSGNSISSIPSDLKMLVRLETLDLSGNQLALVPAVLLNMVSLSTLNLSQNRISALPGTLSNLSELRKLNLSGNILEEVPSDLRLLTKLEIMDLSGNRIKEIPSDFGEITSLQQLILNNNEITNIPNELGRLLNLIFFDVSYNNLTNFHDEYGDLSSLQDLNISHNNIKSLPDALGELSSLAFFNASHNQLTKLHDSMVNLQNLESLIYNDNQVTELPDRLWELEKLTSLDISNNQICIRLNPELEQWLLILDAEWKTKQYCPE